MILRTHTRVRFGPDEIKDLVLGKDTTIPQAEELASNAVRMNRKITMVGIHMDSSLPAIRAVYLRPNETVRIVVAKANPTR